MHAYVRTNEVRLNSINYVIQRAMSQSWDIRVSVSGKSAYRTCCGSSS